MARHAAADGASSHPIVEEALRRHRRAGGGAHRSESALPGREGPIGWPGPDHGDEHTAPIGWPGGLPGSPDADDPDGAQPRPDEPAPERPRGWWRLLGRSAA